MIQVAIFNKAQLVELRKDLFSSHGDTQQLTLTLFDQMGQQILVSTEEIKKLKNEAQSLRTQLQVSQVEIKKLKEQSKK